MKTVTSKLLPLAAAAMLACLCGPVSAQADNTNTTIQEGRININQTVQYGSGENNNATYQTGKININRTIQLGGNNRNQTGQFGRVNHNRTRQGSAFKYAGFKRVGAKRGRSSHRGSKRNRDDHRDDD